MITEYGIKKHKKYGIDWHYKGIKSGDVVRYNPLLCSSFYWQKEAKQNNKKLKLTKLKNYIVEYAYSSMIQIKCDTGRIVTYSSTQFEIFIDNTWIRL